MYVWSRYSQDAFRKGTPAMPYSNDNDEEKVMEGIRAQLTDVFRG